jgi:2-C-methyl-D-erythritol 4-phosphate cytidylyltransferase
MNSTLIALVPAAGIGSRAATGLPTAGGTALPKQYRLLNGQPMLRWAVRALLADARVAQVRVLVAPGDAWVAAALHGLKRTVWRECGGPTRAATVQAGLLDAGLAAHDWVLVHDAARPGLPAGALARLIDTCLARGTGGLLAQPVADTVKKQAQAPEDVPVSGGTLNRDGLWLAQTPQMFQAGLLMQALLAASTTAHITDEASAMELAGHAPCLVQGAVRNFKVTWPEDFELMERWLAPR